MNLDFIFKHVSKILRKCLKNGCKIENIATFKSARKLSWDDTDTRDYEFVIVYIEKGTFKTVTQYKNGDVAESALYKIEDYFKSYTDMVRVLGYLDYEYEPSREGSLMERIKAN